MEEPKLTEAERSELTREALRQMVFDSHADYIAHQAESILDLAGGELQGDTKLLEGAAHLFRKAADLVLCARGGSTPTIEAIKSSLRAEHAFEYSMAGGVELAAN